jgi:RimJ/RimL family protein N-acetyltransferase
MLAGKVTRLRPLRVADRTTSVRWRNDPQIRDSVLGYRFPVTEAMEADWIDAVLKDRSQTRLVLAVEDASDQAFVGFVYLNNIDWYARNAEFGILIGDPSRQGKSLAKEALALVAAYAFETLNLNRLYVRVAAFNARAQRLFRGFGFVEEGTQRKQAFVGGRYHDIVLFGLLREEYHAPHLERR